MNQVTHVNEKRLQTLATQPYGGVVRSRRCGSVRLMHWAAGRVRINRGVCIPIQVSLRSVPFICSAAVSNAHWHVGETRALSAVHSSGEGSSNWTAQSQTTRRAHTPRPDSHGAVGALLTHDARGQQPQSSKPPAAENGAQNPQFRRHLGYEEFRKL